MFEIVPKPTLAGFHRPRDPAYAAVPRAVLTREARAWTEELRAGVLDGALDADGLAARCHGADGGGAEELLTKAGLETIQVSDHEIKKAAFFKTILNSALNALSATTWLTMAEAMSMNQTRLLARELCLAEERERNQAEKRRLLEQMRAPLDLDGLVADIPNPQVAAEVYAASLFAIEVDTPAERDYLARLAAASGLDAGAVQQLHAALGVR